MKCIKIILFCAFICCFTKKATAQFISVDDTKTKNELVNILTNNTSCVNTSNSKVTGDTFTPGRNSYGYFNNQGGSFPLGEGIILSTSTSINSIGGYFSDKGGGDSNWLGDTDLDQTLMINSINATVLEFDFVPLTNFISFNYIFASNEYQSFFPCQYSDGFAFLIKEKGSTAAYQNLAVIPGTTTPVSSKTIHPIINQVKDDTGILHAGCPAINENYFNGFNTNTSPINYSGQTVIMNAHTNVVAGTTYHIKLVVADDNGRYYDSAIFLEAGSFTSKIDLGSDRTSLTNNPLCYGENFIIDTKLPAAYSYKWYKNGIELVGETNPTYNVSSAGTYKVETQLGSTNCMATGEIKIEYAPEIVLNNTTLVQCDNNGNGISVFDLTKADAIIKNNDSGLSSVTYFESLADAQAKINEIQNPKNYTNKSVNQIIFARVSNSFDCANYAELTLKISNNTIPPQNAVASCDTDNTKDGLYQFDLNSQVTPQILNGLPSGLLVEYYSNPTDATKQNNPLPNIFKNTIAHQQMIYARIINGSDCYGIIPITLIINTFSPPNFQDENIALCTNGSINISINTGFSSYLWNTGATTNEISVGSPGDYSVVVTNTDGCEATKKFHVTTSKMATITGATVNDFAGNQNSITIEYTGDGDYEFSIDGSNFQDDPQFKGVATGTYVAYARDKKGCGLSNPFRIYVLDYPRFFTPNGDGFNDLWMIKNLDSFPKSIITIFDRYGKLLKQLSSTSSGWNGTFNGFNLPSDDYWFTVDLDSKKIIKGHFSLKR